MKPKNDFQRNIWTLRNKVPPLSNQKKKWMRLYFVKYKIQLKSKAYCLECGKAYATNDDDICTHCKVSLTGLSKYNRELVTQEYFNIVTVFKNYQLIRLFNVKKYMKKNRIASFSYNEVGQVWIDKNGDFDVMSVLPVSYGYNFIWSNSPLEFRVNNKRAWEVIYKIGITYKPKNIKIIPIIKRNGFNGETYCNSIAFVFIHLLIDSFYETLYKQKAYYLLENYSWQSNNIKEYWSTIKITLKQKFVIKSLDLYFDYIRDLVYFDKDITNPYYICNENYAEKHLEYVALKNKENEIKHNDKDEQEYREYIKPFNSLVIKENDITILPLFNVMEFKNEGDLLNHCVYTGSYYNRKDSLILSSMKEGVLLETIEIDLNVMEIVQARGYDNKATKYHSEIIDIVNNNIGTIKQLENARI